MSRIRRQAAAQATAEYLPQKQRVRRDLHAQVHSLRTEQPALEHSIATAEQQLRHSGLSHRDLAIALSELAHRNVDVGSSVALQVQQAQQEGHGELVDLSSAEGAAQRSALAALQQAAMQHRQDVHDEIAGEQRGLATDIRKAEIEKHLGLGDYRYGKSGLTPSEQRNLKESHDNAAFYAKQLVAAARGGIKDEKSTSPTYGQYLIPPGPHKWDDKIWGGLVEKVADKKGVDSVHAAQKAIAAIRDHFQPNWRSHETAGSALDALRTLAVPAAAAILPKQLAPIAQFALR